MVQHCSMQRSWFWAPMNINLTIQVTFRVLVISELDWGERPDTRSGRYTSWDTARGVQWTWVWVRPRAALDTEVANTKPFDLAGNRTLAVQHISRLSYPSSWYKTTNRKSQKVRFISEVLLHISMPLWIPNEATVFTNESLTNEPWDYEDYAW